MIGTTTSENIESIERYILRMRVLLEFWIVNGNITMGKLKSSFLL
jgi:hypothetical protein